MFKLKYNFYWLQLRWCQSTSAYSASCCCCCCCCSSSSSSSSCNLTLFRIHHYYVISLVLVVRSFSKFNRLLILESSKYFWIFLLKILEIWQNLANFGKSYYNKIQTAITLRQMVRSFSNFQTTYFGKFKIFLKFFAKFCKFSENSGH